MSAEMETVKCFLCNQNIPKVSAQGHSRVCPALKQKEETKIDPVEEKDSDDDSEFIEDSDIEE